MSSVLIGIATIVIVFVLAGYGVYSNVEASQRTQMAMTVGQGLDRLVAHVQDLREETGRSLILSSEQEASTGYVAYDSGYDRRAVEARPALGLTFRYHYNGAYWTCAETTRVDDRSKEAMSMAARDRPGAFVSGECGVASTPIGGLAVVSIRSL